MHVWDLPSTFHASTDRLSTTVNFRVAARPSVNFLCIRGTFHQHSVCRRKFPPTSVNFLCVRRTFCQLSVHPRDLPSTSINSLCILGTFCQYFCASVGPSENVSYGRWTFCELQSTFRGVARLSVNFPCNDRTFCQLSIRQQDIPSNSINFMCIQGSIHQLSVYLRDLPSTFCVAAGPSINFRQL